MAKGVPSIFRKIPAEEKSALVEAIKGRKYWKISEDNKDYVYTVALSRARIMAPVGYYVKTSAFGRIQALPEVSKYCRRYRVLLVDLKGRLAVSVLTWMAFKKVMEAYEGQIERLLVERRLPFYINSRTLSEISKSS
ncbi:MAG: hypothetical protein ACUVQ8_04255 [Nitrososphaeria archaeon]